MSAGKHTPGPWTHCAPTSDTANTDHLVLGRNDHLVAGVIDDAPPDEVEANARLIAAAPDMLAALKATAGNIRSLGPAGALSHVPFAPYQEWLAVVDAAIAKAEGRS